MRKKILISIIVLLSGFLLAGISFYIFGRIAPSRSGLTVTVSPRVPSQIIETSKAFSEIANSVSPVVANISTTKVVKERRHLLTTRFLISSARLMILARQKNGKSRAWAQGLSYQATVI